MGLNSRAKLLMSKFLPFSVKLAGIDAFHSAASDQTFLAGIDNDRLRIDVANFFAEIMFFLFLTCNIVFQNLEILADIVETNKLDLFWRQLAQIFLFFKFKDLYFFIFLEITIIEVTFKHFCLKRWDQFFL